MLLKLQRTYNPTQTDGILSIDGRRFCTTIEPPFGARSGPIICPTVETTASPRLIENTVALSASPRLLTAKRSAGCACCVPEGWYRIEVTHSPRFRRLMPILRMVPGFTGIRIHAGLSVENTQGCICVGYRNTEEHLTQIVTQAQNRHEEIYIHIYDAHHDDYDRLPYDGPDADQFAN